MVEEMKLGLEYVFTIGLCEGKPDIEAALYFNKDGVIKERSIVKCLKRVQVLVEKKKEYFLVPGESGSGGLDKLSGFGDLFEDRFHISDEEGEHCLFLDLFIQGKGAGVVANFEIGDVQDRQTVKKNMEKATARFVRCMMFSCAKEKGFPFRFQGEKVVLEEGSVFEKRDGSGRVKVVQTYPSLYEICHMVLVEQTQDFWLVSLEALLKEYRLVFPPDKNVSLCVVDDSDLLYVLGREVCRAAQVSCRYKAVSLEGGNVFVTKCGSKEVEIFDVMEIVILAEQSEEFRYFENLSVLKGEEGAFVYGKVGESNLVKVVGADGITWKLKESVEVVSAFSLMYSLQRDLQEKILGKIPNLKDGDGETIEVFKNLALGCYEEVGEILRSVPWKPWKDSGDLDLVNIKEEVIDLLHMVLAMGMICDMNPLEMFEGFLEKNKRNHRRQEEGY